MALLRDLSRLRPSRLAALGHRLVRAAEVLGPRQGLKAVLTARRAREPVTLRVPGWPRPFWFRGWADAGILGHLFMPGFEVVTPPGDPVRRIIDGGANIGGETLRFRLFHPDADIVAVEAAESNLSILRRNFDGDPHVEVRHAGLWSTTTPLRVEPGGTFEGFHVREARPDEQPDVVGVGLADLLEARGWSQVDVLKLDIEGAEWELFGPGAAAWIHRVKVLLFECPDADRPGTTARIFKAFADLDVDVAIAGEKVALVRRDSGWRVVCHRALPGGR
jgi:FkbM family methyltransferase